MLRDIDVLPNQMKREVNNLFTNSNTYIFSEPPLVETVHGDDEINCKQPLVDKDHVINMLNNNNHVVMNMQK